MATSMIILSKHIYEERERPNLLVEEQINIYIYIYKLKNGKAKSKMQDLKCHNIAENTISRLSQACVIF